jgi:transcription factor E
MFEKSLKGAFEIVAGKQAENLVILLDGRKYINEFVIAKKMNLTINQVRNLLYKISDHGLVSSIRKKDKRKGWYTYFWKIEIIKCLEFLKVNLLKSIEQLQFQIKSRQTKEFYVCGRCNIEFGEENALIHNFECNECGGIVSRKDNSSVIREHGKELDKMRRELSVIETELGAEREKAEKIRAKERKKEEEIKKRDAAQRKKAGKKTEKKKPVKKTGKKTPSAKKTKRKKR